MSVNDWLNKSDIQTEGTLCRNQKVYRSCTSRFDRNSDNVVKRKIDLALVTLSTFVLQRGHFWNVMFKEGREANTHSQFFFGVHVLH